MATVGFKGLKLVVVSVCPSVCLSVCLIVPDASYYAENDI